MTIEVKVRNKIASVVDEEAYIVCGNSDYEIAFDFDGEWAEYSVKTACFTWNHQTKEVVFEGNVCPVPVLLKTLSVVVGVFAGNLRTSTPALIKAKRSALCEKGVIAPPPQNVYNEIMDEVNKVADRTQGLSKGEGENSHVLNDKAGNRVVAPDSVVGGSNSVAGCRGFYISAIDFTNKRVYLSDVPVSTPVIGEGSVDLSFVTPEYDIGDDIGIMFTSHCLYTATIAKVENNVVTYDGDLGFDESRVIDVSSGYEFFVLQHPEIGSASFTRASFGFGDMVRAIGYCCVAFGQRLFAGNFTGLFGRNNKASTYTLGAGYGTVSSATHAFFSGVSHILKGYCIGAIGANLKVKGVCTFVTGDKCDFESDYSSGHGVGLKSTTNQQHIVGSYNKEDKDAIHIVGIGGNDTSRKNAFTVKWDGSATVAKQGTSDDSVVINKTLKEKVSFLDTVKQLIRVGTAMGTLLLGGAYEASGTYSTALGLASVAKGYVALAMGYQTLAEGGMTIAGNKGTIARKDNSTALGQYNAPNYTDIFQIGNGTSDTDRKNAFVVKMDGSAEVQKQGIEPGSVVTFGYVQGLVSQIESLQGQVATLSQELNDLKQTQ